MGIQGLLPFTKNSCRPANIRDFKGCTVAIDAYGWLHKGAFSCADKIVKGEKTDGYVHFCMKQINLLLNAGVKPFMVFDGCNLESKAVTEKKRHENREKTRQKAKEFLCQGNLKEARECFQRCIDITPEMAFEVIQACRSKNIDCIVSPYEADAQLAYLNRMNLADLVITEDSDLIVFGCNKILFKMDSCGGGLLYEKENLPKSFGTNADRISFEKFRYICILSGCDYLPSLPGIGLGKAFKFFTLTVNPDLQYVLSKLPNYLKMPKLDVTDQYKDMFFRANNTFLYQLVFCPQEKALVPLNPYPEGMDGSNMDYAGKYMPEETAYQIAVGNINVKTMERFSLECPNWQISPCPRRSNDLKTPPRVTASSFKIKSRSPTSKKPKQSPAREDENVSTNLEDLFSSYLQDNAADKKDLKNDPVAAESEEDKVVAVTRHCPFRKSLSANSVNVSRNVFKSPLHTIVKSRFFYEDKTIDEKPSETKTSWLDEIDNKFDLVSSRLSAKPCDSPSLKTPHLDCEKDTHLSFSMEDGNDPDSSDVEFTDLSSQTSIPTQSDSGIESLNESISASFDENAGVKCSPFNRAAKRTSSYFDDSEQSPQRLDSKKISVHGPVTRCRTIGLSKNKRPKLEKQLSIKETLFNFNFTRNSKINSSPE